MKMKWKNTQNDSVPGPGNYDGQDKYLKSSAPQWKIGTESRFKDGETSRSRVEVPGPGKILTLMINLIPQAPMSSMTSSKQELLVQ